MTRTDIYRPSAIVPSEYQFVALGYIRVDAGDILANCALLQHERDVLKRHMEKTGGDYSRHEHGGNCHICGAHCIYTVIFYHEKTNTYIRTGNDCAEKLEMSSDEPRWNRFVAAIHDARLALAGKKKAMAILEDKGMKAAWDIYLEPATQAYEEATIVDIVGKLVKFGSVSDKALNYVGTLLDKIAHREEIEAQRKAEAAKAADVPTGRHTISGEVISIKTVDGFYGSTVKMLVKDEKGFKVFGTIPSGLDVERGAFVKFDAFTEPSNDDPKFGFFKRPSKAVRTEKLS